MDCLFLGSIAVSAIMQFPPGLTIINSDHKEETFKSFKNLKFILCVGKSIKFYKIR